MRNSHFSAPLPTRFVVFYSSTSVKHFCFQRSSEFIEEYWIATPVKTPLLNCIESIAQNHHLSMADLLLHEISNET